MTVVVNGLSQVVSHTRGHAELLLELSREAFLCSLPRLHLPPGEFPVACKLVRGWTARKEEATVLHQDRCGDVSHMVPSRMLWDILEPRGGDVAWAPPTN